MTLKNECRALILHQFQKPVVVGMQAWCGCDAHRCSEYFSKDNNPLSFLSTAEFSYELHCVEVPILSDNDCENSYPGRITESMMCAGYLEGGKDACQVFLPSYLNSIPLNSILISKP